MLVLHAVTLIAKKPLTVGQRAHPICFATLRLEEATDTGEVAAWLGHVSIRSMVVHARVDPAGRPEVLAEYTLSATNEGEFKDKPDQKFTIPVGRVDAGVSHSR